MKPTRTLLAVVATATAGMIAIPVLAQEAEDDPAEAGTTEQPSDADNEPAAQDDAAGQDTAASDDAGPHLHHEWSVPTRPGVAPMMGDLAADLAEQLGIGEQEVADALDAVMQSRMEDVQQEIRASLQERLDELVADDILTRAQADALVALSEVDGMRGMWHALVVPPLPDDAPEELQEMVTERLARAQERLDDLVADGDLTKAQADTISALLEDGVELPELLGGHVVERHDQGEVHGRLDRRDGDGEATPDGQPRWDNSDETADGGPSLHESGRAPTGAVPSGAMPTRSVVDG